MSSVLTRYGTISQTTKFQKVTTPTYYDSTLGEFGGRVPIPFIYSNQTLDINVQDNVIDDLIDSGDSAAYDTEHQCKSIGGIGLVQKLGPNMITWLENWLGINYDANITNISVYTPGQVTRAQFVYDPIVDSGEFLESDTTDATYGITDNAPSGDEYVMGTAQDNYRSVWIFKTPLTIRFFEDNGETTKYLTLFTNFASWYD